MYAIVQLGSDQFKVSEGDIIEVDRLLEETGKKFIFSDVLMFSDGKDVKVGHPTLSGAKVEAEVVQGTLGDKVFSFKYRHRKAWSVKKGHRAKLTAVKITKIAV
jgi:large subunit ribosomal protein L21